MIRPQQDVSTHARRKRRRAVAIALTLAAALAGGAGAYVAIGPSIDGCGTSSPVIIAASPTDAPMLAQAAQQWRATRPTLAGKCIEATILTKAPDELTAMLGSGWSPERDGPRPHAWIPDSSLWLAVAAGRADVAPALPERPVSVAASPVVLALRGTLAQALGWPQRTLNWTDVIGAFSRPDIWANAGHPEWALLRVGMIDPSRSTAGLATALAVLDPAGTGTVSNEQLLAALGFTNVLGAIGPDSTGFFRAQDPKATGPDAAIAAFPALEREVAAYTATDPPAAVVVVPIYDTQNPFVADYPFATLAGDWVTDFDRLAAEQFRKYLLSPAGQAILASAGLRAPDRTVPAGGLLAGLPGFGSAMPRVRANPKPAALNGLIAEWANLQRRVNLLAVLDTSGSMAAPVPGTGLTRLALLQQIALAGFGFLPNTMSIGLWEFSDRGNPQDGYRELVPFGPIGENISSVPRRQVLLGAVPTMRADGGTPLYDTAYAAFKHMQQRWQPNSSNAVLLITDGRNEVEYGLTLDQLISKLEQERDPERPVQIVSIAVGPAADADALKKISDATGGSTFVVRDPATAVTLLTLAFTGRIQ